MLDIVSFIQANSLLFIILGFVLVFAFIGYIAELSGYKKVEAPKEEAPIKEDKPVEELVLDFDVSDLEMDSTEKKKKKSKKKKKKEVVEETPVNEESAIQEGVIPLEDLNVPLEGVQEEPTETEDLYAPIGDTTFEPVDTEVKPIDASLPELDTIKDSQSTSTTENDIWKF